VTCLPSTDNPPCARLSTAPNGSAEVTEMSNAMSAMLVLAWRVPLYCRSLTRTLQSKTPTVLSPTRTSHPCNLFDVRMHSHVRSALAMRRASASAPTSSHELCCVSYRRLVVPWSIRAVVSTVPRLWSCMRSIGNVINAALSNPRCRRSDLHNDRSPAALTRSPTHPTMPLSFAVVRWWLVMCVG
jgi:hypothetical protein